MDIEDYREMKAKAADEIAESIKSVLDKYPDLILTELIVDAAKWQETPSGGESKNAHVVRVNIISEI